jgi:hypothetical protein
MTENHKLFKNQTGLVSIIVTIIIMLIISLIVIGFAKLTRREQRQSLDRQLSTQAFYAAESGINDAVKVIKTTPVTSDYLTSCDGPGSFIDAYGLTASRKLDGASGIVSYTCLFVDASPPNLELDSVDSNGSEILPIQAADGGSIDTVVISWQGKESPLANAGCGSASPNLVRVTDWTNCTQGLMRVDLVPTDVLNRDDLIKRTMTTFLYPKNVGGSPSMLAASASDYANQGTINDTLCDGSQGKYLCTMKISTGGGARYILRLKSIYKTSVVNIEGLRGGSAQELAGAQATIDATGKANDVLRRIQVRVPLSSMASEVIPDFAIHTAETLCKRFQSAPPNNYDPDGADCDILN